MSGVAYHAAEILVGLETVQKRALRSIHPGYHDTDILYMVSLPTLENWRKEICKVYYEKIKNVNHKLHHLLPEIRLPRYARRNIKQYPRVNTNRYGKSLIPWGIKNCQ